MKIKQMKVNLKLEPDSRQETIININYDNSEGSHTPDNRFFIMLPSLVAGSLGINVVRAKTQEDVVKLFWEAIGKFKHLKVEKNRVIIYEIELEPSPDSKPQYFHYSAGYKVSIWASAYIETVAIAGDGGKRYSYEKAKSSLNYAGERISGGDEGRIRNQVPWTEQNEAFFLWVENHMKELIAKLAELKDPGKLVDAINAGRLLPLGEIEK